MSQDAEIGFADVEQERQALERLVADILAEAKRQGATSAEVSASKEVGISLNVRLGELETLEFQRDGGFGITLFVGQAKGGASTNDTSPASIQEAVSAALFMARHTAADPYAGLAEPAQLAREPVALDLYHPTRLGLTQAIELAQQTEAAGRAMAGIDNSDGAAFSGHESLRAYGNSLGFIGSLAGSRHSLSCSLLARQGEQMERDQSYGMARRVEDLPDPLLLGREAADKTLARLGARSVKTGRYPVIYAAEVATSLLGHFVSAVRGSNLYRKSSFLLDKLEQPIFHERVTLEELPHLPGGWASTWFDQDGLATAPRTLVEAGRLKGYVLDLYAARRLGLASTANAGGIHNLWLRPEAYALSDLLAQMDRGLLVTELMGQGVNLVTGDYSRGAAGFWVEHGQIQYPVQEITLAGKLPDMFRQIQAIGQDVERRSHLMTGSLLIESMMVAGH